MRTELSSYKDILILTRKAEHVNYGNVKNIHQAEKKPAEAEPRPVRGSKATGTSSIATRFCVGKGKKDGKAQRISKKTAERSGCARSAVGMD